MRIHWADNARAIGIILVLFGHTHGINPVAHKYIYSFHMPLFFFLSGYVLKKNYLSDRFIHFLIRNIKNILIPYFSFWVISYPYGILVGIFKNIYNEPTINTMILEPFIGLLYGIEDGLYNSVLWFFTCLFCAAIIFYWINRVNKKYSIILLLILGILGPNIFKYIDFRLPWNIELSFVAVVFYGFGYFFSEFDIKRIRIFHIETLLLFAFFLVVLIFTVQKNGEVNMSGMKFGNLIYYYFGAFSGIYLTIIISRLIPKNKILNWISLNTIIIFPLHILIFTSFTAIGIILFGFDQNFNDKSIICSYVYTVGAIILCVPLSFLIRKYTPWVIGIDREKAMKKTYE